MDRGRPLERWKNALLKEVMTIMKCKKMNKGVINKKTLGFWKVDGKYVSVVNCLAAFDYGVIIKAKRGELPWVK